MDITFTDGSVEAYEDSAFAFGAQGEVSLRAPAGDLAEHRLCQFDGGGPALAVEAGVDR